MKILKSVISLFLLLTAFGCTKDGGLASIDKTAADPGNDPNFSIVAHMDSGFTNYNRKVVVFGIDIYAADHVESNKLLHAANLMAQYLDNDEDGIVDNHLVLNKMKENK